MGTAKGYLCVLALALIPVMIWAGMQPLQGRFINTAATTSSIGQLLSIVGMVLFAITLILNTRLDFLEDIFGGQDRVYKAHHMLGAVAFIMLLFHPIFLSIKFVMVSVAAAAHFLLPLNGLAQDSGIYALLIMEVLLILTFYVRLRYHKWRFTHQFLGVSFAFASVHVLLISSDVSRSLALRLYLIIFIILGLLSFTYKTVLGRVLVKKHPYTIESVKVLAGNITDIILSPVGGKMAHHPGQFAFVSFTSAAVSKEPHPFSISSSPSDQDLRFCIKSLGDYTLGVRNLRKGDHAFIEGPYGRFTPDYSKPQVWIAGGIGITPFLSMAHSMGTGKAVLFYSVPSPKDAVFLDELRAIKGLSVVPFYTNEQGYINSEFINHKKGLDGAEIYICGPPAMMNSLKQGFINLRIPTGCIHTEEFAIL